MKVLHIRRKLPQILVPNNKIKMFVDWWNADIRKEKSIPHSFEEGYFIIHLGKTDYVPSSKLISYIAKSNGMTFREIETQVISFLAATEILTIYFKLNDTHLEMYLYDVNKNLLSHISSDYGESETEENTITANPFETIEPNASVNGFDNLLNKLNIWCIYLFATVMWYLATTKNNKYYEEVENIRQSKHTTVTNGKRIVNVKNHKTISTPIYNLAKVRKQKTERLSKQKAGWTYSHSFLVHGHYRHYKNGKVIFIAPFVKGKDKEFKSQMIILSPKEN